VYFGHNRNESFQVLLQPRHPDGTEVNLTRLSELQVAQRHLHHHSTQPAQILPLWLWQRAVQTFADEVLHLDVGRVHQRETSFRGIRRLQVGSSVDKGGADHASVGDEGVVAVAELRDGFEQAGSQVVAEAKGVDAGRERHHAPELGNVALRRAPANTC
jgi:hypothetical protein